MPFVPLMAQSKAAELRDAGRLHAQVLETGTMCVEAVRRLKKVSVLQRAQMLQQAQQVSRHSLLVHLVFDKPRVLG
jgi:hypothetical protein